MLFVVFFVSFPFAWQRLLPSAFVEYAESILSALLFASNFFFYFITAEYGADSSLLKPFLHTWSIGVEEQFYLAFPIIAIVATRFFQKHFLTVLVGLCLISLQLSEAMEVRNPELNFYLPFSRFWELFVGCMLAYRELYYRSQTEGIGAKLLPMLGLYLITYSVLFFDGATPHPSFHTIIPVVGVALIIGFASKNELVGWILGSKPFVWLGLISYSAYLWHFPVFAFSRVGANTLDQYDKFELLLLTVVLSALSYFIIEKPFRNSIGLKPFLVTIFVSGLLVAAGCLYIIASEGVATKHRLGLDPKIIETAQPSYFFGDEGCADKDALYFNETQFCVMGDISKSKVDFLLVGDSHAMHAQPLLSKISDKFGLKGIFGGNSGCPPLLGIYPLRGRPHPDFESQRCYGFNQNGYDFVKINEVKIVFLVARWDYYVDGANTGQLNDISDTSLYLHDIEQMRKIYDDAAKRTFEAYKSLGVKVVVVLQVPHQNTSVNRILEDLLRRNSVADLKNAFSDALAEGVTPEEHMHRQKLASSVWRGLANLNDESELVLIDPTPNFCGVERCRLIENNYALYTDTNHASERGYDRLEEKFTKAFGF